MKTIISTLALLLFLVFAGAASAADLVDNGNGTVTDLKTGLTWQQGEGVRKTWEQALAYAEGLTFAGYSDWRLPNRNELESLTDDTKYDPAIDTAFFPGANSAAYWSSTTDASYTDYAWFVHFGSGSVFYYSNKTDYGYVRCVRGGQ